MSPEISRPKPNISKGRSYAINKICSSVQTKKEENNASEKLEVCKTTFFLNYIVLFALYKNI